MNSKHIFLLLFSMVTLTIHCYSQDVRYSYDASGNRIKRHEITIGNPNMRGAEIDTTQQKQYIEQFAKMEIKLTSNPTKGNVAVSLIQNEENQQFNSIQVMVVDNQGKTIINKKETTTNFNINLENYSVGIYYLTIVSDKEVVQWKIIKE